MTCQVPEVALPFHVQVSMHELLMLVYDTFMACPQLLHQFVQQPASCF